VLCIKITQEQYEKGITYFKINLHGRLITNKEDKPLPTLDMMKKLSNMWETSGQWKMISFGK